MIIRDVVALSSLAVVLSAGPSYPGPCTQQIFEVRDAAKEKMKRSQPPDELAASQRQQQCIANQRPRRSRMRKHNWVRCPTKMRRLTFRQCERAVAAYKASNLAECENALTEARCALDRVNP
jgi:hypothetical protein